MMATSALTELTGMPKLPLSSGLLQTTKESPKGYLGGKEVGPILEELKGAEAGAEKRVGEADIAIEKSKREEKNAEAEQKSVLTERLAQEARDLPERKALGEARGQLQEMSFVPTKETAQDLAAMFSLISVVGMVTGKGNAQLAMSAMNGMLEGHQKGRADLYKKQQVEFDKNFKAMQAKISTLEKEVTEAMELKKYDKEAGEQKIIMALAKAESPLLKAMKDKQGDVAVLNAVKGVRKDVDTLVNLQNNLQKAADERQARKDAKEAEFQFRKELASMKQGGVSGKALTDKQSREVEGLDSLVTGLEDLKKTFKPEFASLGVLGFGADLEYEAKRRLGDKKGQEAISWWSKYERLQAPNRHALFGATLTGNELKNYQSFTAKKSDSPETVKTFLDDQIAYSNSVGNNKKLVYEAAGYKVPEAKARDFIQSFSGDETQNLQQEAIKRFGSYDPSKYDYGFEDGKFYRDAK
jgi:hypothetical protein